MKIIVTGSGGLIGKEVAAFLKNRHQVVEFDLAWGIDLRIEKLVKKLFRGHKANALVNLFALNDHVANGEKQTSTLFDLSLLEMGEYLRVNVTTLFSVCREYARNNETGSIVNFGSTYGVVSPDPRMYGSSNKNAGYCVSKAAVIYLTKYLAVHLAPKIRVNCIVPGGLLNDQGEDFINAYKSRVPMGRMMESGELNHLVELLCEEKSSYMTGSVLNVDGGWVSW